jgi:zinc D-Ala-D-Ala carboxypeptidase
MIEGIAGVQARIASIQARAAFATTSVNGPLSMDIAGPADPTTGFDPFGAVYQEAMAQAGIVDRGAGDDATGTGDGSPGSTSAAAPPVYGTGQVATFTPGEFAALTDQQSTTGTTTGTTTGSTTGTTTTSPAASYTVSAYDPSSYASSSSTIGSATGVTTDPLAVLDGPVYTGASRRAASQYGTAGVEFTPTSTTRWVPTGQPGASIGKVGGYGPMPVTDEQRAIGNGHLTGEVLQPIGQGGHRLYAPAAAAWRDAVAAAAADGIDLRITDSYRSYDNQVNLADRKGLYSNGGYAATPGTSNHGWGMAVDADVTDPATLNWMRDNAWKFGWVEAVPREPWHWEFRPQQA